MNNIEINLTRPDVEKAYETSRLRELLEKQPIILAWSGCYERWLDALTFRLEEFLTVQHQETAVQGYGTVNMKACPPYSGQVGGVKWTKGPVIV